MGTLAVIILTKNEEKNIVDCLKNVSFADERIVIDSDSKDKTRELAEKQGAHVFIHSMSDDGFAGQRNFALSKTRADWVLYLDADERLSDGLKQEISCVVDHDRQAAYCMRRINIVFGQRMWYGEHRPDEVVRLFPRGQVYWIGIVHERAETKLPVLALSGDIEHYTYTDWNRYFEKFNQYTNLMAKRMDEAGKKVTFCDILLHPIFAFIRFYFIRLGFMDGRQGFIFAINHFYYTMIKYVKCYYHQREGR